MRKSRQEASETRRRIVDAASKEFRRNGINATGLSDLMAAAGLTHGGFYRHFSSKDDLVAEVCASAAEMLVASIGKEQADHPEKSPFEATVEGYLAADHRDNPAEGCPFAALGSELTRGGDVVRGTATEGFREVVDVVARQFGKVRADVARGRALSALATMIGALTMSRMVDDPDLSAEILRQAKRHLLRG
ncbi:TetR family transcriptional regulator [Mycobacterium sp. KBS0706]|uniref:TetR/AcrR family transcriptional regulator n=1 Tax=Mycobacterium sp. KBS0706 TaxID=2578109 RepID=UPI00110FA115|nr:TetR family transcriptional regulator [Mycobacterium sp. KBS0706]TSD83187.1 TetR family transcriptional regulator [Mycobacterium sp. KBS0706]